MNNEEKIFTEIVKQVGKWLETPKAYVINPERAALLKETCEKLQSVLDEESHDCTIEIEPCPLGSGDVIISFDTYSVAVRNVSGFYEAIRHLSNFEVYPIGDEMVRFAGVFSNVAMVAPLRETGTEKV